MTTTPTYKYAGFTNEDFRTMLVRGAQATGNAARAAVHLINASGIDLHPWVQDGVFQITTRPGVDGHPEMVAFPAKWTRLTSSQCSSGSAHKLMELASSFAGRGSFDLSGCIEGLTPQHAQAVAEAVLIAAGVEAWYTITQTTPFPFPVATTVEEPS